MSLDSNCIAMLGTISNTNHYANDLGSAGKRRYNGFKPTVRGVAKNPCDHPHGGGNGKKSPPIVPQTPWGKPTK